LQTPYSFFGLGRTNNYIENLFVGATVHAKQHFINMEGVIPNSKLVILPSAQEGEAWKRELFLRPGKWIPWVTLTVILGTVVLAVVVLVLRLNEMVGLLFFVCWLLRAYGCTEGGRVGEETGFSSY
jgi:integrin alpha FG-GAP repeat containing protein 1